MPNVQEHSDDAAPARSGPVQRFEICSYFTGHHVTVTPSPHTILPTRVFSVISPLAPCPDARRSGPACTDAACGFPTNSAVVTLTPAADHVCCQLVLDDLGDLTTTITRC
nr:hypothetical protein [Mycobacterium uberis]